MKGITPLFQTLVSGSMTGTSVLTTLATNLSYKDSCAMLALWTGTANGTFQIQGSVDYVPALVQNQPNGISPNSGTWINVPTIDASTGGSAVASGSASSILFNLEPLAFPWIQLIYTNASSTGTLNVYVFGKSFG